MFVFKFKVSFFQSKILLSFFKDYIFSLELLEFRIIVVDLLVQSVVVNRLSWNRLLLHLQSRHVISSSGVHSIIRLWSFYIHDLIAVHSFVTLGSFHWLDAFCFVSKTLLTFSTFQERFTDNWFLLFLKWRSLGFTPFDYVNIKSRSSSRFRTWIHTEGFLHNWSVLLIVTHDISCVLIVEFAVLLIINEIVFPSSILLDWIDLSLRTFTLKSFTDTVSTLLNLQRNFAISLFHFVRISCTFEVIDVVFISFFICTLWLGGRLFILSL